MSFAQAPLATLILNQYAVGTVRQLADAIEEICSPKDNYGFASSGIYIFWDVYQREALYVGLAVDLGLRFRQHNGMAPCPTEACKRDRIEAHLAEHGVLGYTVLVQSPLDQALCAGWAEAHPGELDWIAEEFGYLDAADAKAIIDTSLVEGLRWTEGALIRGFAEEQGRWPAWNRTGGANIEYDDRDLVRAREMLKAAALLRSDYSHLISHCSMVELAASATHVAFESFLHGARLLTRVGHSLESVCEIMPASSEWERIKATNYLAKLPQL